MASRKGGETLAKGSLLLIFWKVCSIFSLIFTLIYGLLFCLYFLLLQAELHTLLLAGL